MTVGFGLEARKCSCFRRAKRILYSPSQSKGDWLGNPVKVARSFHILRVMRHLTWHRNTSGARPTSCTNEATCWRYLRKCVLIWAELQSGVDLTTAPAEPRKSGDSQREAAGKKAVHRYIEYVGTLASHERSRRFTDEKPLSKLFEIQLSKHFQAKNAVKNWVLVEKEII